MPDARQPAEQPGSSTGEGVLRAGQELAHYTVVKKIGEGGMGQVYLAEDRTLARKVALKTLTADVTQDRLRLQRFKREAKAVAALNHPNIVTIYSHESASGVHFLTMEYVAGKPLTQLIKPGGMSLSRIFDIGVPMADAVGAAHENGITHRDIKPGNVMFTDSGRVKVLDFGLAKLRGARLGPAVEQPAPDDSRTTGKETELLTQEGAQPGTFPYMSPEQIRAKSVDQRTDIYSLGVVLYEMATGRRPFESKSSADLITSVIRDLPPALGECRDDLPHHLERIVARCLEKDPERRYQSAKDLRNDLADLERELDQRARTGTLRLRRRRPWGRTAGWWGAIAATAVIAWGVAAYVLRDPGPIAAAGRPRQITASPTWEAEAVLSPDGELLAYESEESGNADIWLLDIHDGSRIQLTSHPGHDRDPTWFPDGSAIAFEAAEGDRSSIWKVPRLGGQPTMLLANAAAPAISPDGSQVAFSRVTPEGDARIGVASLTSALATELLTGSGEGLWTHSDPAWSPDGKWLCYADFRDLWVVSVETGEARQLTSDGGGDFEPVWSTDGRYVYFSSYREGTQALWRVSASGGRPQRMTMGTGPESHPSISRDGSRLAYTTFVDNLSIVLVDLWNGERHTILGGREDTGGVFMPDMSSLIFTSYRRGTSSLWRQPLQGILPVGEATRLNDDPADANTPQVSADGRWIAYQRREGAERQIWIQPAGGGVPGPLTDGPGVKVYPSWSPDDSHIVYVAYREGRSELWLVPVSEGRPAGEPRRLELPAENLAGPDWSPDGQSIAVRGSEDEAWEVWLVPVDGSTEPRQLTRGGEVFWVRWHPEEPRLLVSGQWGENEYSLRWVDLETGRSTPLDPPVRFGPIVRYPVFELAANGRFLALTTEEMSGDLWLLEAEAGTY